MTAKIIPFDYQGRAVRFDADGWLHATEIADRFGKEPHEWLRLPDTERYLEGLQRRYGEIPYVKTSRARADRGGGTWLHPKLAVKFARWLDVDFEIWCDEQLDTLLRGESKSWANARREAAIGHRAVCDAIALNCEAQGKTPQRHHFINEARLINQVITGSFAGRDRDQLSAPELEIVTLAELRDTVLIGGGMAYAERRANLLLYVRELQSKHQREIAA
ncbi:KilA-N domain-containing protein [Pseudomonas sp. MAFF212428]|uniref:KilA-N domain-containing protein n=1 Tax=Pseudomonas brassicae TaxID=2708063 RepID=A0A6B3NUT1_9PSED|nr:KilA-N domain-containing protein [Pseudomonas brassicae]NER58949.1 KilA-N domain-containing protein [Pseudomonas brassicae]NER63307.1 KilA-N domain-containing protein [Pseudomonas brassicae]